MKQDLQDSAPEPLTELERARLGVLLVLASADLLEGIESKWQTQSYISERLSRATIPLADAEGKVRIYRNDWRCSRETTLQALRALKGDRLLQQKKEVSYGSRPYYITRKGRQYLASKRPTLEEAVLQPPVRYTADELPVRPHVNGDAFSGKFVKEEDMQRAELGVLTLLSNAAASLATQWVTYSHLRCELERKAISQPDPQHPQRSIRHENIFKSSPETVRLALGRLASKGLLEVQEKQAPFYRITKKGQDYLAADLPAFEQAAPQRGCGR